MKTKFHILAIVGVAALLGGCSTTPYMTLAGATDEAITKLAFPAPTPKMRLLRSKYIAATVGLYGAWAVKEHSKQNIVSDSDTILRRLDEVEEILAANWSAGGAQTRFEFRVYVADALRLVKAATAPARRRYKEAILSSITSSNPIGAAKTALTALKNLLEIETYKGAIVADARGEAIAIFKTATLTGTRGTRQEFEARYCKNPKGDEPGWWSNPGNPEWWDPLPKFLKNEMCKGKSSKLRPVDDAWINVAKGNGLGSIQVSDADWMKVNTLFQRACRKLSGYAETANPCDKFQ